MVRKTGKQRSGNPATRAAERISVLWPFALDYYVQASRLQLFEPVSVTRIDQTSHVVLPDLGAVRLATDVPAGENYGAVVMGDQNTGVMSVLLTVGDSPEVRVKGILDLLTGAFVNELGSTQAAKYARDAVKKTPALTNLRQMYSIVDVLLGRPCS